MKCPECEHEHSQVVETITLDCIVWRRRACLECDYRWWTSEIEDEPLLPIWPKKHAVTGTSTGGGLHKPSA